MAAKLLDMLSLPQRAKAVVRVTRLVGNSCIQRQATPPNNIKPHTVMRRPSLKEIYIFCA